MAEAIRNKMGPDKCQCDCEAPNKFFTEIGRPVVTGTSESPTDYTFYQCSECGAIWTEYADSGLGGGGKFRKKLIIF